MTDSKTSKDVVFFDGDGTLWYPKSTLRTCPPHWIYTDERLGPNHIDELIATPYAAETLQALGEAGITRVLLSTSPLSEQASIAHRRQILARIGLGDQIDDIVPAPVRVEGKREKLASWLVKHDILASRALMVGDTHAWDIVAAQSIGVQGVLLHSEYQADEIAAKSLQAAQDVSAVLPMVGLPTLLR